MRNKIKKYALLYICFWVISCLLPVMSWARLAVQTEVVSGNIAQKYEDRSIKLDNGKIYLPSREGLSIDLPVGEPVTLRYVVEDSNKNIFFEFASGLNSLKKLEPELPKKNNGPK
jgi:hypothetical protein